MTKKELDFIQAELVKIEVFLRKMPHCDVLGRMSFESRKAVLLNELEKYKLQCKTNTAEECHIEEIL